MHRAGPKTMPKSCWEQLGEHLVPSGTFGQDIRESKRALHCARICLFTLYVIVVLVFLTGLILLAIGRAEIIEHRVKYDRLEAPSVAVCPWNSGTEISVPQNATTLIEASKVDTNGIHTLPNEPKLCKYDRLCYCLSLEDIYLEDVEDSHHGPTRKFSEELTMFREAIEIRTPLMDPSDITSLKVGFYDSVDPRPSWVYVKQFDFAIGELRMDSWMVSEAHFQSDFQAMAHGKAPRPERRHFYVYTFSTTDAGEHLNADKQRYTYIRYEFRNYFVLETVSSHSVWSLWSLVTLCILLVAMSSLLQAYEFAFPKYDANVVVHRTVSWPVRWLTSRCCGFELRHEQDHSLIQDGKIGYGSSA